MNIFVTGGAGFIGSNFSEYLLQKGHTVTVYDNFSTGKQFLENCKKFNNFKIVEGDLLDKEHLNSSIKDSDIIIHLAANADVRFGLENPYRDIEQKYSGHF